MFGQAPVGDYNLNVAGSGEDHTYGVSGNYFDQSGTAAYNDFRRGSVRANTQFNRGKFTFGENAAIAAERRTAAWAIRVGTPRTASSARTS